MQYKYRVFKEGGGYDEYLTIEEIPDGISDYETIELLPPSSEELNSKHLPIIQEIFTENRFKAQCFVIGKTGSKSYIAAQRESYENKYLVARGDISNVNIENALQTEANDLGITIEILKFIIIQKYESALEMYQKLLSLNESCRTRLQTLLENKNIESLEQGLELYSNIVCEEFVVKVDEILFL